MRANDVDTHPIDFVLTWVDGQDPTWLEDFRKHSPESKVMNGEERFRDWDNLQFLFRAFEKFTPWVNKIYFVTYGHVPEWLNLSHPKLVVVKHEDFMPIDNLPVFNVNPLETNFHRIKGLSEHFVYFNDDTFLLRPLKREAFFKHGLPVQVAIGNVMSDGVIAPIILNNLELINKNFNRHKGDKLTKRQIIMKHFWKWFYPGYGMKMLNTLLLMKWRPFTGFVEYHQPQPHLKRTFCEVWEKENYVLGKTAKSKFRSHYDVSQYLFKNWNLVKGEFWPMSYKTAFKRRKYVELRTVQDVKYACDDIKSGKFEMYCLNDALTKGRYTQKSVMNDEFIQCVEYVKADMERVLPNKSDFEK